MANGLFGWGGMGGMNSPVPSQMQGLIDPEAMRRAQLKQMLLSGGLAMLSQGPSDKPINLMSSIGQGLQQGVQSAQTMGKDYRDMAYQGYQMNQDAERQKYAQGRDASEDAWRRKQFEYGANRDGINDAWREKEFNMRLADKKAAGGPEYGLNPVWLQNDKGEWMLVQPSKDGSAPRPMQMPEGYRPAPQNRTVDTGTGYVTMPTRGEGQPTGGMIPKDIVGQQMQEEIGTNQGKKIAAAPNDIAAADNALALIDSLRNDPNKAWGVGGTSMFNMIPGTPGRDFQVKLDQATAGAFMTGIQQMRGMGALSDAEGKRASSAVARMDTSTSEAEFDAALNEYEAIVLQAKQRASQVLGGAQTIPQPMQGGGNLRQKYGLE